jgi:hypothetical protein
LCGGVAGFGGDFGLQIMQDQYINHIMTKTGTEVAVRGIGSGYLESFSGEELQQPLHLLITGDNFKGVDDARRLAENLLDTIRVDSVAFRPPTYQASADRPPLNFAPAPVPSHVRSATQHSHLAYQQPNIAHPVTLGAQPPEGGFYPLGYPPGPQPWPPVCTTSMATPALQPPTTEKMFMDPYANMLPPTKVYGAVPPPQQLAGGGATESFSSIKSDPESRLAADQVQTSVSNTPAPLLPVSIPGSVKQGSIMVSGIQPVSFCMEGYSE